MRRLNPITALGVGALLLAAPAALACGELVAMRSQCPMAAGSEMMGSMGTSMCHKPGQMAKDCCDVGPVPEPLQAFSTQSVKLLKALEVMNQTVIAPVALKVWPPHALPADACRLHDLERYTLFSSFLL